MSRCNRIALALAVLAVAGPGDTYAQRVDLAGRGPVETDTLLERIARTPGWVILTRDTTIQPGQTLSGPVLAAGNRVFFAGTIPGDLVIVDANVFVRPQARIAGNVINIGGGFFRASDAIIEGDLTEYRDALYRVVIDGDVARITAIETPSLIDLDGFRGLQLPLYDRVNGLTLRAGLRWIMPRLGSLDPSLRLGAQYSVERERPGGNVEFALRGRSIDVAFGAERTSSTNDEWVRSDALNSLSFVTRGRDYRDYYEADRLYARITNAWTRGRTDFTAGLRIQSENARSLTVHHPWILFEPDSLRTNPTIDDGRINSVIATLGARWDLAAFGGEAAVDFEGAGKAFGADFAFGRFDFTGNIALNTFLNHTLIVEWRGRGPLPGTDSLPRQRWSTLGGRGTLYTFDLAEFRGDRLAYVETEYLIPIPIAESAPIIGRPAVGIVHHTGMAWTHAGRRDLEQNLGLRLRLRLVWVLAMINPDDTDRHGIYAGVNLPIRYPWWPDIQ